MPRGYGVGRGYWRPYGRAIGRGYWGQAAAAPPVVNTPGYQYVGPCRCGRGPNAFYRAGDGTIVHASSIGTVATVQRGTGVTEVDNLRTENERLAAKVRELEERLESR